ncbi:MAG: recombinase RecA [Candidatus Bipolaricaulia bacterium]
MGKGKDRDRRNGQRQEVLEGVLEGIRKRYGDGAIMWLGEQGGLDVEAVPTGSLALDIALGVGGVPRGRIVEVFGPEAGGKTTLALHLIAEVQKQGGTAAFIDAEHSLDPTYAQRIGVDIEHLLLSQPNSGEQALEITEHLVRSGAIDIIVIDSVAALVPEAEIAAAMGEPQVGLQARLMSQAMRKLAAVTAQSRTIVVFINQIRSTIATTQWGPKTTTTGGLALKFYTSLRLDIRRIGTISEGDEKVGNETLVRVVKNKVAPPFREARFDIIYGKGIDRGRDLINVGAELGVVQKSGAWFSYNGTQLGQGLSNSAKFLAENSDLAAEIEAEIREKAELPAPGDGHLGEAAGKELAAAAAD